MIKIRNSNCSNVISTSSTQITCEIEPKTNDSQTNNKDLPILISINGIENQQQLLFSYNIPWISNEYTLPEGVLHLKGSCFGNKSLTLDYLNEIETSIPDLSINDKETTLSFQLPINKTTISISVNGIKSNTI